MPIAVDASTFRTALRVLTFRASRDELAALGGPHLVVGLAATWIVGMGRYWDDPGAGLLQHLGVGSLVYVVMLSGFLWVLIKPLGPEAWSYVGVLTFVASTSPPAVLYAIPVERFLDLDGARLANVCFLGAVATWRVALLVFYLRRLARLSAVQIVATLLPLAGIVTALTALNLERAVFEIMAGFRETPGTANDGAYEVLWLLSVLSALAAGPLVLAYLALVASRFWKLRHRPNDRG